MNKICLGFEYPACPGILITWYPVILVSLYPDILATFILVSLYLDILVSWYPAQFTCFLHSASEHCVVTNSECIQFMQTSGLMYFKSECPHKHPNVSDVYIPNENLSSTLHVQCHHVFLFLCQCSIHIRVCFCDTCVWNICCLITSRISASKRVFSSVFLCEKLLLQTHLHHCFWSNFSISCASNIDQCIVTHVSVFVVVKLYIYPVQVKRCFFSVFCEKTSSSLLFVEQSWYLVCIKYWSKAKNHPERASRQKYFVNVLPWSSIYIFKNIFNILPWSSMYIQEYFCQPN